MRTKRQDCSLYYGAAITDRAIRERQLPLSNPATTKRMLRIASAFRAAGEPCAILSPAIMPRIPTCMKRLPQIAQHVSGVPVLSISQFGSRFVGYMLTPFTAIASAVKLARRRRIKTVIQYCYFPDAFIFSLWCKIAYRSVVILDLEDICRPRLSDWRRGSETRPLLQLWGAVLMRFSIWLADMVIVPSKKFAKVIPPQKCCVVTGCQPVVADFDEIAQNDKMTLLFSGGITDENGINVLMDALRMLDDVPRGFVVKICGAGVKREWAEQQAKSLRNVDAEVLGFLDNRTFEALYSTVDICFALQNPGGRHGFFKTPSKGYEALCSAKALIVSDIGDFHELPDDICCHLRPYTAERLAAILAGLTQEGVLRMKRKALEYAKSHFDIAVVGEMIKKRLNSV